MISRKTARTLGEAYGFVFRKLNRGSDRRSRSYSVNTNRLYDFLFDHDYPAWLCNAGKNIKAFLDTLPLKEFVMRLHTGETVAAATPEWSWDQRKQLGQKYLEQFAADMVKHLSEELAGYNPYSAFRQSHDETSEIYERLLRSLELDGYTFSQGQLHRPEEDALDVRETSGVLQSLYQGLNLRERETAFHHLSLSEDHYIAQRWDDCIGNARKFLELVLSEVSSRHCLSKNGKPLATKAYESPREVRDYLEQEGLLETREKEALAKVYGLLSHTGSHPYMAASEQARLLRHMALTFAQFVMLRLQGALAANSAAKP